MRRTIMDILRKGNLELFHSAMMAWLLDPSMEHNLGRILLDGIAVKLDSKGFRLKQIMDSSTTVRIRTEVTRSKSRYDIEIHCGDSLAVVLENKTKSIGDAPQFEVYSKKTRTPYSLRWDFARNLFLPG